MPTLKREEGGVARGRNQQQTRREEERDNRKVGGGGLEGLRIGAVLTFLDGFAAILLTVIGLRGAAAGGVVGKELRRFQDAVLRRQEPEGDEEQREEALARSAHGGKRVAA